MERGKVNQIEEKTKSNSNSISTGTDAERRRSTIRPALDQRLSNSERWGGDKTIGNPDQNMPGCMAQCVCQNKLQRLI
ncbi:hypothetical protein RRG08_054631 [Elysia crispata]|uniref:Uncharacterized protein n=1 Tax=Elysia crispata TaxID=231223 RepID=A0AAE1B1P4_9GAST|nr:hypothetical protein RRG08_054631 [Elysia crispata]